VGPLQLERHLAFVYILHSRVFCMLYFASILTVKKIISYSILKLFLTSSRAFVRTTVLCVWYNTSSYCTAVLLYGILPQNAQFGYMVKEL